MTGRDVRLVPAALLAWGSAWFFVTIEARTVLALAVVPLGCAMIALWRAGRPTARRRSRHRAEASWSVAATVAFTLALVGAVMVATASHQHTRHAGLLPDLVEQRAVVRVSGVVRSDPLPVSGGQWHTTTPRHRAVVEVASVEGRGQRSASAARLLVLGGTEWARVELGARVSATGRLVPTEPGDDVIGLLISHAPPDIRAPPPPHHRLANDMRAGLIAAVADRSGQAQGLVPGIAVGDDSRMPGELDAAMKSVSLTHITAVSGTHLSIVLGAFLGALHWAPRWVRAVGGGALLVAFVVLVRPEPSVLRAAVMGGVSLLALILGRPSRALPALCGAVIGLLILDPWLARTYGFVLSALATAGIVVHAGSWARAWSRRLPPWAAMACAIPAAAQAWCAPVIVLLNPAVAAYAVPANVLAAPLVVPATILGVLATVVSPWLPGATSVLVTLVSTATAGIAVIARFFAGLPLADLPWPPGLAGTALLGLLTVAALLLAARRSMPPRRWVVVAGLVVAIAVPGPRNLVADHALGRAPERDWIAAQCDVGQGSAFVVRSAPRAAVLIDTGAPESGVDRCLTRLGIRRLDLLVLTHLHLDHVGGMAEAVAGREVGRILLSPHDAPLHAEAAVLELAAANQIPVQRPVAGEHGEVASGHLRWQALWPTARIMGRAIPGDDSLSNDLSLVLRLETGDLSVIALGDLEDDGQRGLLASQAALAADVVVVAHHGSPRQLPALADAIGAPIAVVSVGDNDYGHPAPGTIDMYEAAGGVVLRTDECGEIVVTRRGGDLLVHSGCGAAAQRQASS
ncbi:MAG TPA: ComEC/Rec2 family competence protein [Actinomycetaceae bacterium]|nr:ComEC/Rec2 family competence protein [Actinomycetaceae bacterium]